MFVFDKFEIQQKSMHFCGNVKKIENVTNFVSRQGSSIWANVACVDRQLNKYVKNYIQYFIYILILCIRK